MFAQERHRGQGVWKQASLFRRSLNPMPGAAPHRLPPSEALSEDREKGRNRWVLSQDHEGFLSVGKMSSEDETLLSFIRKLRKDCPVLPVNPVEILSLRSLRLCGEKIRVFPRLSVSYCPLLCLRISASLREIKVFMLPA
jgi:hypothetical protein